MALKCSLIVFFVFTVVVTLAEDVGPQPPITVLPVNTSTPEPPTTAKPTVAPTTVPTTVPTTAPTTKPTTVPTTKPTTAAPTTTSTAAPTTKPTIAPTPTPTPTPVAPTDWIIKGQNGTVCVMAHMNIQLDIPYKTITNKTLTASFKLDNITKATATGQCGNDSQSLNLSWKDKNVTSNFFFAQNSTTKSYALNRVVFTVLVNNASFPNHTVNASSISLIHDKNVFSRNVNNSYSCSSVEPLHLNGAVLNATLILTNAHVEAFGEKKNATYSQAVDCVTSIITPDIVPIVVGLILAGLVVFVLIAYLVGRHRAQSRGYVSM